MARQHNIRLLRHAFRAEEGNVLVETALVMGLFATILLGTVDFGMAWIRHSEMENAVRAGLQFGLARHPSMGEVVKGVVTTADVREAVERSAPFLADEPGTAEISFSCECPDGTAVQCTSTAVSTLPCSERRTFLHITLAHDYDMLFNYPGVGQRMSMAAKRSVRLN